MSDQPGNAYAAAQVLIDTVDPAIFALPTATSTDDRRSLLSLQTFVRRDNPSYVYLEIGSEMGGTLVPHLLDLRCRLVVSVDKRPDRQPDERSVTFDYTETTTARMLERLGANLPASALLKLLTHDCDAAELSDDARATPFDLAFIDGEHTNRAAFQDFLSLWRFAAPDCIIAFHDANLVTDGIANVEAFLCYKGVRFEGLALPESVFAILVGTYAQRAAPLARLSFDKETFFRDSKENLWRQILAIRGG